MPAELKEVPAAPAEAPKSKIVELKADDGDRLKSETSFTFECLSAEDGKLYKGDFVARRQGIGAFGRQKVLEGQLNGGVEASLPKNVLVAHHMIAYLATTLAKWPEWWNPDGFFDDVLLSEVYNHVRHWESSFRRPGVG